MAKNRVYAEARQLSVAVTDPATPVAGDPVVVGQLPGVALTDERADGTTTVAFEGVFNLSVRGVDGAGNSAVAVGDILYYVAADTPKLSKKNTGVRFGYALGTVNAGATATIPVKIGY